MMWTDARVTTEITYTLPKVARATSSHFEYDVEDYIEKLTQSVVIPITDESKEVIGVVTYVDVFEGHNEYFITLKCLMYAGVKTIDMVDSIDGEEIKICSIPEIVMAKHKFKEAQYGDI